MGNRLWIVVGGKMGEFKVSAGRLTPIKSNLCQELGRREAKPRRLLVLRRVPSLIRHHGPIECDAPALLISRSACPILSFCANCPVH